MYIPQPIDTSDIKLSEELLLLIAQLARNMHDNWAIVRINDDWAYGPEHGDDYKHQPCLVDYDDLLESVGARFSSEGVSCEVFMELVKAYDNNVQRMCGDGQL